MANWFGRVETIVVGILSCVFGAILFSRLDRGLPIWASFFVGPGLWIVGGSIAMSWLFNRMFQRAQRSPRLETPAGANQTHKAEMPDSSRAALQTSATEAEQVRIEPAGSTSANPVLLSTPVDAEPTPDYFWVVTCKNDRFHQKENIFIITAFCLERPTPIPHFRCCRLSSKFVVIVAERSVRIQERRYSELKCRFARPSHRTRCFHRNRDLIQNRLRCGLTFRASHAI